VKSGRWVILGAASPLVGLRSLRHVRFL